MAATTVRSARTWRVSEGGDRTVLLSEKPKNSFIEVWRGVAVLLVVWYHYTGRLPPAAFGVADGSALPFYSGKVGVLIFFVISGFLIAKSLEFSRSLADFYAKRLSRIWPLFIVTSIVIFLVLSLLPTVPTPGALFFQERRTLGDLLTTVFFLEDIGGEWIDGAFWSILVELKFYLWFGLVAAIVPRRHVKVFATAALLLSGFQMVFLLALPDTLRPVIQLMNGVFVASYLPFFALGALLYRGERGPLFSATLVLTVAFTALTIGQEPTFDMQATARFLLVLVSVVLLDGLVLRQRVFLLLGRYSYAWYLVHQVLGLNLIHALAPGVGYDAVTMMTLVASLGLAIALSWLSEWRFRRQFHAVILTCLPWATRVPVGRSAIRPEPADTGGGSHRPYVPR